MVDHILLIGRMGSGKSTLASQMAPEYLVLNFDGRWVEQNPNVSGKYHLISNADPIVVVNEMEKKRPGLASVVQSVIVDSGTQILDYVQSYDRLKNADAGDKKWMNEAFKR
ncbi:MAG TPA: ATP-binding protein, partial [Bellilinea sp.]|nr:ATP-binding protein [Bellilinea sp.]